MTHCRRRSAGPSCTQLLYRAQANDAYWHGLFGGCICRICAARSTTRSWSWRAGWTALAPRPAERRDADLDGVDEIFLQNGILQAVVRDDADAAVIELDSYSLRHNFGDTLRGAKSTTTARCTWASSARHKRGGIASAHDRVRLKHAIRPRISNPTRVRADCFWTPGPRTAAGQACLHATHWTPRTQGTRCRFRAQLAAGRSCTSGSHSPTTA